jgi:DNA mismatch endonuclease, patch repair protein
VAKLNRNHARDKVNLALLRRAGWTVLILWECQIKPSRVLRLRQRIDGFLNDARMSRRK